jgi:tetratricopeptide (TPR) repeat protein
MKRCRSFLIVFLVFCITYNLSAQDKHKIDSLKNLLKTAPQDTNKVWIFLKLGNEERFAYPDTALYYYQEALALSQEIDSKEHMSRSYMSIGVAFWFLNAWDKAIENYENALKMFEEMGNKDGVWKCYNNIGMAYKEQGSYDKALEYYMKALKIEEEINDKDGIASSYNNIGILFRAQNDYNKARDYHLKALKLREEIGDKKGMSESYNNLGIIFDDAGNFEKSVEYYNKSIKIDEELNNKNGIANCLNNVGYVHFKNGFFDKAAEYFQKSLKIYEELNDKRGISIVYSSFAELYIALKKYNLAVDYADKALIYAKEIETLPLEQDAYEFLYQAYDSLGDYKKAYEYHKLYTEIADSLFNEASSQQIKSLEALYQNERKQKEIELQKKEISKQKVKNNYLFGAIALVMLVAIILVRAYVIKRKNNKQLKLLNAEITEQKEMIEMKNEELNQQNEEISAQRDEIESQKSIIEIKNKNITASIAYALRIQQAILPDDRFFHSLFPDSFVLYKPKDIVSGDFYWVSSPRENLVMFAAIDCTGHGVPGAFMSIVGYNLLQKAISEKDLLEPASIINSMNNELFQLLRQKDKTVKDGMDMVLCCFNKDNMRLSFAGVRNSLLVIRNREVLQFKTDKHALGEAFHDSFTSYNQQLVQLEKGDTVYVYTDGFSDQFGGVERKKYSSRKLISSLLELQDMNMDQQKASLESEFELWKGVTEQIDDVLLMGVRF